MSGQKSLTLRAQRDDLRAIAAMIIPASREYNVPGADDAADSGRYAGHARPRHRGWSARRSIIWRGLPASR